MSHEGSGMTTPGIPMTNELRNRLTVLRDEIVARLAHTRVRQMAAEHALSELDAILSQASSRYPEWSGTAADANKLPQPRGYVCPVCSHGTAVHREHGCDCDPCDCPQPFGRLLPVDA